jgi:hypothetical protein
VHLVVEWQGGCNGQKEGFPQGLQEIPQLPLARRSKFGIREERGTEWRRRGGEEREERERKHGQKKDSHQGGKEYPQLLCGAAIIK